ncbi:DUF1801 domain-containing protein [Catalinimonas niigatensis]|uniref:DUF1801 domain-containing protein n=1 Tax=Catalinimonas niigatensis TaxID=1397264 RepID=UPI002AA29D70|nr:DUF1801 domain-containing protein [Catalinimonas niigatensis]WPP52412.1 DUF1801 domain-containing protein [Catalinimonas niigatensis]
MMQSEVTTPEKYLKTLPEDRREVMTAIRNTILENLPKGFEETMNYGMFGYVVPLSLYPEGYHCDPKKPLPFMNLASQKNYIALYHMAIYTDPDLLTWFTGEYAKHVKTKLDMGKSCIRFKKMDQIPYALIGELCRKISPQEWINVYEKQVKRT